MCFQIKKGQEIRLLGLDEREILAGTAREIFMDKVTVYVQIQRQGSLEKQCSGQNAKASGKEGFEVFKVWQVGRVPDQGEWGTVKK